VQEEFSGKEKTIEKQQRALFFLLRNVQEFFFDLVSSVERFDTEHYGNVYVYVSTEEIEGSGLFRG